MSDEPLTYHITIPDSKHGTLLDQDAEAFVLIRETEEGSTRVNSRGYGDFSALGLATWWADAIRERLSETNRDSEPLADDLDDEP